MEIIKTGAVIDIPENVAICPYCNSKLYAQFTAWQQEEDGSWSVSEDDGLQLECESAPDLGSKEYKEFVKNHSYMPYVFWMPIDQKVEAWIRKNYRFDME